MKIKATKAQRRTHSESSVNASTIVSTPCTPLTPASCDEKKFDFDFIDDVFESKPQIHSATETITTKCMNFDEMSNCLITLMDHSSINGDNVVSGMENIGNGYKQCDNNYDSINYVEQNELLYFT
jgi:hypothetical protein